MLSNYNSLAITRVITFPSCNIIKWGQKIEYGNIGITLTTYLHSAWLVNAKCCSLPFLRPLLLLFLPSLVCILFGIQMQRPPIFKKQKKYLLGGRQKPFPPHIHAISHPLYRVCPLPMKKSCIDLWCIILSNCLRHRYSTWDWKRQD